VNIIISSIFDSQNVIVTMRGMQQRAVERFQ